MVAGLQQRPPFSLDALPSLTAQNPLTSEIGWSRVTTEGTAKVVVPPAGRCRCQPTARWCSRYQRARHCSRCQRRVDALSRARSSRSVMASPRSPRDTWWPGCPSTTSPLPLTGWCSWRSPISLGLLLLVGLTAGLVIRRELKPLEVMAQTADEIAAGDLDRRVDPGAPGTEVGRLGTALNDMLDGIQGLLAERDADEERLRRFIADASHELRTPVSAIRGYTDLYRAGALPEEVAVDRAMDRMGFESRRMGALVDDLLTLTQADSDGRAAPRPDRSRGTAHRGRRRRRGHRPQPGVAARRSRGARRGARRPAAAAPGVRQPVGQRPDPHAGRNHRHRLAAPGRQPDRRR